MHKGVHQTSVHEALRKIFAGIVLPSVPRPNYYGVGSNNLTAQPAVAADRNSTMSLLVNLHASATGSWRNQEALLTQTVLLCIRLDVLCGAVTDGIFVAVQVWGIDAIKRQGGHLQAIFPGCKCIGGGAERNSHLMSLLLPGVIWSPKGFASRAVMGHPGRAMTPTLTSSTSCLQQFLIYAQLCTRCKGRSFERTLLLHCYQPRDDDDVMPLNPSYEFSDEEKDEERVAKGGKGSEMVPPASSKSAQRSRDRPNAIVAEQRRTRATATRRKERRTEARPD